jgi:hypothetical protein
MTNAGDLRKEAEEAIEVLKTKRVPIVEMLNIIDHAIVANKRIIELAEKFRDE